MMKQRTEPRKVVHVSDIHIMMSSNARVYEFFSLLAKVYENEDPKPIIAITGDLVDGNYISEGEENDKLVYKAQFKCAKDIFDKMKRLGFEVIICPGNHDYPPNGSMHNPKLKYMCDDFFRTFYSLDNLTYPVHRVVSGYHFFVLDSNDGEFNKFEKTRCDGKMLSSQLIRLKNKLMNLNGETVFILLHHHPLFPVPTALLNNSKEFFQTIKEGNVGKNNVIVLFGHLHMKSKRFCPKKYGVRDAVFCCSSTAKDKVKDFGFVEITPNNDENVVLCNYSEIKKDIEEEINDKYFPNIKSFEKMKVSRGFIYSGWLANIFCCGCL